VEENRIGLILMLLREGSRRHAVKAFQEEADVSYFVARRAVQKMAREHGIEGRRRGLVPLALIALAGAVGLVLSQSVWG
jgi:hypothetical protein